MHVWFKLILNRLGGYWNSHLETFFQNLVFDNFFFSNLVIAGLGTWSLHCINRMLLKVYLCPTGSWDTDDNNSAVDCGRNSCDLCSRERLVIGKSKRLKYRRGQECVRITRRKRWRHHALYSHSRHHCFKKIKKGNIYKVQKSCKTR